MSININSIRLFFLFTASIMSFACSAQIVGEYDVIQYTPRGERSAVLKFDDEGKGEVTTERGSSEIKDLKVDGGSFEFQAMVPTPFGKSNSQWTGEVEGDDLKATIKTKMGSFEAVGTRIEE